MSSPEVVVGRWFTEVWNERREAAIDELMASDAKVHGFGPEPMAGTAGFRQIFQTFSQAFPDLRIEVVRTVREGDLILVHIHATGRHSGAGLAGPPTNRPVSFQGMVLARVEGGRIVEGWNCIDFLTMYQQMGWVGNPVAAS
jgi:predicted ester cyclase